MDVGGEAIPLWLTKLMTSKAVPRFVNVYAAP